MKNKKFELAVKKLYDVVNELETIFPGRPFTPDGHLVGSIGECLVAEKYGLELKTPSNKGFDALTSDGKQVEIKTTQANSVGFRSQPEYCIVIQLNKNGTFQEIYNGPGIAIWKEFKGKKLPSNGQFSISLKKLSILNKQVQLSDRIEAFL